jgi:hypothetical protein
MARTAGLLLAAIAFATTATATPDAEAKKKPPSITTPGYKGTTKAPKTAGPPTPAPVAIGKGLAPDVFVDDAGTAHVVWTDPAGEGADVLHYCRLKRGARTCDISKTFVPDQPAKASDNTDQGGPRVLAYGGQLVLLTQRQLGIVRRPDGGEWTNTVYAYVSDDGGDDFVGPAIVGGYTPGNGTNGLQGTLEDAATFGPPGSEQIGLLYAGGFFQAVRRGTDPPLPTDLTPGLGQNTPLVSLAARDGGLMASLTDLSTTAIRVWNRTGDAGSASQWSPPKTVPGANGTFAAGPSGNALLTFGSDTRLQARIVDVAGTPGKAETLTKVNEFVGPNTVAQDGTGKVIAGWIGHAGASDVLLTRAAAGGSGFAAAQTLLKATKLASPVLGAGIDGGGFAGITRFPSSGGAVGDIVMAAFGSQGSTGKPGLGNVPGGGSGGGAPTPPGVVETCSKISFGAVDVAGQAGCLLGAVGQKGVKVSEGTLRLNGLEIVPDDNVKILMNARQGTIDTTGGVTVQLRAGGVTIPIFYGELHLNLPSEVDETTAAPGCTGQKLFAFDAGVSKPSLKGFPMQGQLAVYLTQDSLCMPVSLGLPKVFGGLRANAVLKADNARGLHLDSLAIAAPTIPIGPVLIQNLAITYDGGNDTWSGGAKISFPPGWVLDGRVRFKGGEFEGATVSVSPAPWPGVPLFTGVYLSRLTGGFEADPLTLLVGARVGALPTKPPDGYAIAVDGQVKATFKDPFTLEVSGSGELFGFGVASVNLLINSDFYFAASAKVDLDFAIASVSGELKAFVDGPRKQFGGEIAARVKVFGYDLASGEAVISSNGIGACARIFDGLIEIGAGYKWGDDLPFGVSLMWGDCDLGPYRIVAPGPGLRALARATQARTFTVAANSETASVRVTGAGGPPSVVLVSPSGERITPVQPGAPGVKDPKAVVGVSATENAVYLALPKPAAGGWGIEAQPGSPAIVDVQQATALPDAKVTAKVGGKGRARTLSYTVANAQGRTVTFFEATKTGVRALGTATGSRGVLKFTPSEGPSGRRTIAARVEQDGLPRGESDVATYTAPAPARPARPGKVRVSRKKGTLTVTWAPARGAVTYAVRADLSDGRRMLLVLPTKARAARFAAVPKGIRATVTVSGRNGRGRSGPGARARG